MALPAMAAPPKHKQYLNPTSTRTDNTPRINVNNILMFVTNHGNYGRDLAGVFGNDAGTYFPYAGEEFITNGLLDDWSLYAMGMWVGGKVDTTDDGVDNGDIRIIINEYSDECVPGPMLNGEAQNDQADFKVYKLYRDSLAGNPNADYLNWPEDQGAPVNEYGEPDMIGDQMLWAVYNDADPDQHDNDAGATDPLGLEIKQTTFAFDRTGALGNMIFVRFRIYNNGSNVIDSCFFSVWADPDLGDAGDDLVGCDTLASLGFVYNDGDNDAYYAPNPPCVGADFFQGPLVENTVADTADDGTPLFGLMWGDTIQDYHNLGMASFNKYINGSDPNSFDETYAFMKGWYKYEGVMVPYTIDGVPNMYMFPGDPVTGVGDLDFTSADRRWMQSTGPITFAPGDSTEILVAYIFGRGSNYLNSITVMRELDVFAQALYPEFNPPAPPAKPVVTVGEHDGAISVNWGDTSEVDHGAYPFQGYTVWQGDAPTKGADWMPIATFDIADGQTVLRDILSDPNSATGTKTLQTVREGNDRGTAYSYVFLKDHMSGIDLFNFTDYYFKVSAFSFDSTAPDGDRFLESETILTTTPRSPAAGMDYAYTTQDMLEVDHAEGGSDGVVTVEIIDPSVVTGDDYRVTFVVLDTLIDTVIETILDSTWYDTTYIDTFISPDLLDTIYLNHEVDTTDFDHIETTIDSTIPTYWHLTDDDTGVDVLYGQLNQAGGVQYHVVDGLLVKVMGPELGVIAIDEVADAAGPLPEPDNVIYSLNSTGDWYMSSDDGSNLARMNWRGYIETFDWEIRFTAAGSQYYDWNTDLAFPADPVAPFEFWNIGIGTPDDPSDDVQIFFSIIDDDESGGWSYGDRIYSWEQPYVEPAPIDPTYIWDTDFRIGRIQINDYSGATTAPDEGTIIRFTTAKINTTADVFTFSTDASTLTMAEASLDAIKTVPNPFYLFGPYEADPRDKQVKFINLPDNCTIRIYNLGGDLVKTLTHDENSLDPTSEIWNTLSGSNIPVASGIYIYHVDAPGFGEKIGKMAIFTEVEVLNRY